MKKSLFGLALLVLAAPAFSADKEILVPALTPIPFVVSNAGDLIHGYVKDWGFLVDEKGPNEKAASQVADHLEGQECAFNFGVNHEASGRLQLDDGVANLACLQADRSLIVTKIPGFITDRKGVRGLKSADVGEFAFFVPQTEFLIHQDTQ
ncbi:hypothetical protein LCG56_28920 (plasmid) [Pseudomonas cannabina pv. alisalensis]|uniref:Uncharacterized protein n=1 Tax=Pseudomonas syringae pv. maculicola str. ES4326 TaxID=629265 RepID=A0A8T8C9V9_PSEYM|nr:MULTISPECIES: hypothetical protein [Pseudomonas syringae group]QHF00416.1 hypothetical protein PMA4326_028265 [Pseudomonas syringae pv. maculicola str. ES4326]UBZ00392.1 hypothetical protein LCG56_28920 [Pseudomonas cannabina pv. alisalensis]